MYSFVGIILAEGWINKTDCGVELLGEHHSDSQMTIELYNKPTDKTPQKITISEYYKAIALDWDGEFYKVLIYDEQTMEKHIGWIYRFCTNIGACN